MKILFNYLGFYYKSYLMYKDIKLELDFFFIKYVLRTVFELQFYEKKNF